MPAVEDLIEQQLVESMRGRVPAESTRCESGNRTFVIRFDKRLCKRVEIGKMEVAVQAVHREKQRLLGLALKRGHILDIEDVLLGPELNAAVADIAHQ
jgi:hypothetical protein